MEQVQEAKHTPGPWATHRTHLASQDCWYVIVDANGRGPVMDVGGKDVAGQIAEAKLLVTDEKEVAANARLIAAAPDLLEALRVIRTCNLEGFPGDVIACVDDAIAKATGAAA